MGGGGGGGGGGGETYYILLIVYIKYPIFISFLCFLWAIIFFSFGRILESNPVHGGQLVIYLY